MKKILITGITGFVGSHVADRLSIDNKVYGIKRVNSKLNNLSECINRITLYDGDLLDITSLITILDKVRPDEIYHYGALSWVTPSWSHPAIYMQTNAIGTINLLEAVRIVDISPKILVSCTPEEYGDVAENDLPITELTPIAPINPYASSKVAQDVTCQVYHASYGTKIIRTRAFNHEGARRDKHGALANFAYQISQIERGKQPPVIQVGNLGATRNFTDVSDMVSAYILAMEYGKYGELYLIGTQQIYTIKQCLEMLIELSTVNGITYNINESLVRPTELRTFIGDFTKFTTLTNWKSTIPFNKTLESILEYWRSQ